ncbi:MAG: tetratricopeptide repeat protein [Candidatus Velthaea sp.]
MLPDRHLSFRETAVPIGLQRVQLYVAALLLVVIARSTPSFAAPAQFAHVHHPISSSSEIAQMAFDEGLTRLYAFSRTAARDAFQKAATADPHLAIAYWGIAMSYGANINFPEDDKSERLAYAAAHRAAALSAYASREEQDYIKTLSARFTNAAKPDYDALARAYHNAMRSLARKYPGDPDAVTLYAESAMDLRPWDLYAVDGTPRPGTGEIVAALEGLLKTNPGHIGANHLYIHSTEASLHPERALESAGRLASLTFEPAAAHLTHMPSHTFARTGYYRESSASNVLASKLDRVYINDSGGNDPEARLYYGHDLAFLAYSDEMDENLSGARRAQGRLVGLDFQVPALFVPLRFERWPQILALPRPKVSEFEPVRLMFWHFARGMAFASTRNVAAAARERNGMNANGKTLHVAAVNGMNNGSEALLRLADDVLAAKIAAARHDPAMEIVKLREAVAAQDRLIYIEPPDWYYPVRESLGGALLRAGHSAEAAQVFRDDLARNPGNPRSLFGLREALRHPAAPTAPRRPARPLRQAQGGSGRSA